MIIYGTFVTCFTSYLGKSREKSDYWPITLYSSYSTHLCRNWVSKHQARTKKNKSGQKLLGHGEQKFCQAKYFARRSNGELKGEDFQKVESSGQGYFAMASRNSARRNKAVSSNPDDVAETHWQRKLISPGEKVTFQQKYKSLSSHFRKIFLDIMTF